MYPRPEPPALPCPPRAMTSSSVRTDRLPALADAVGRGQAAAARHRSPPAPVPGCHLPSRRRRLLRRRRRRRRLPNRRIAPRAPQDPHADSERRPRRLQALRRSGPRQDVEGGGLEGLYARQRHQLHPHRPLLGRPVQQLQLLQAGMLAPLPVPVPSPPIPALVAVRVTDPCRVSSSRIPAPS
jgi:hypothetical protein